MIDDILELVAGLPERGLRALLHLMAIAVLFPILGILAQMGYGGWGTLHLAGAIAWFCLCEGWERRNPGTREWVIFLQWTGALVLSCGAIGAFLGEWGSFVSMTPRANVKAAGMTLALVISMAAMFIIGIGFYGVRRVYPALIPGETIVGSEQKAASMIKGFLGGAAWIWTAGLYVLVFGPNLSWETGTLCLFTAMVIILGAWGWNLGGGIGKVIAFYSAVGLFFVVTGTLIAAVTDEFKFWDTFWGKTLEPFAIAAIPMVLWAGANWLRISILLRSVLALASLFLIFRALALIVPSVTWGAIIGYDIRPYLQLDPRKDEVYEGMLDILATADRYTREHKLNNLISEMRGVFDAGIPPSDNQLEKWRGELAAIQKQHGREATLTRARERAASLPNDIKCWLFKEKPECK